ncbi:hypothetical protein BDY21DRAFT_82900 [Lineolata rhizophorae]|uniref:Uncharacterized protein n=1 Tax=Lineolata rhizophorae TaxID=578093 RepID=A0A6A6PC25_9PEZI|nr:hypothetical protein BDY21DRAFT_82900 [Lineolata rhizophorae]
MDQLPDSARPILPSDSEPPSAQPTITTSSPTTPAPVHSAAGHSAADKRASTRLSTYSATPTLAPSIAPSHASETTMLSTSTAGGVGGNGADPRAQEIKSWNAGFARLEDKRLAQQRYALSSEKTDNMSKLALGAKVERALSRRMTGQDATFTRRGSRAATLAEKGIFGTRV